MACLIALPASFVLWALLLNAASKLGIPPFVTIAGTVVAAVGMFWLSSRGGKALGS